jgi:hypothetical protein
MDWKPIEAPRAWRTASNAYMQYYNGPDRANLGGKVTTEVVNTWHVFVERKLGDKWGLAGLAGKVVAGGVKVVAFFIPVAAAFKLIQSIVSKIFDVGLGLGKKASLDKEIQADATEEARRRALVRQFADSRAVTMFAEMTRLEKLFNDVAVLDKIESCRDFDRALTFIAQASYLNNRLAGHLAYLETLTRHSRDLVAATSDLIARLDKDLTTAGEKAFEEPAWHIARCADKKKCLFPWEAYDTVRSLMPDRGINSYVMSSSVKPPVAAGHQGPPAQSGAPGIRTPPPLPPKPRR